MSDPAVESWLDEMRRRRLDLAVGDAIQRGRERYEVTGVLHGSQSPIGYEMKVLRCRWWSLVWRDTHKPAVIATDALGAMLVDGWSVVKGGSHGARR